LSDVASEKIGMELMPGLYPHRITGIYKFCPARVLVSKVRTTTAYKQVSCAALPNDILLLDMFIQKRSINYPKAALNK
jgi:hypothetical protein